MLGGKILAIDVGKRRIGLAISDKSGSFAFPFGFLEVENEEMVV
ncbi:MAG: Holliday junction resolvase RuvX, partial [bacterium]